MNIIQWILSFFKKPVPVATHITIPAIVVGSPDWFTPVIVNNLKDWTKYFSLPYTSQVMPSGVYEDNCAVRAAIQIIEAHLNYYLVNNLFPDNVSKFLKDYYCNSQGYVKLSVRYHSKMCNVKLGLGTDVNTVFNQFALVGLVPESVYPDPTGNFTWEEYMKNVPQGIEQYGEYSTKFFQIIWNVIQNGVWTAPNIELLKDSLIDSPIYFASQIGNIDAKGIEQPTSVLTYQHCRVIKTIDDFDEVLDNYPINGSMVRKLNLLFPIPCAIKVQVKII